MGYRSDVKVLIDIPSKNALETAKEIEELTKHCDVSLFSEYLLDKKHNLLICEARDIKWYSDFKEIKAFNDWIAKQQEQFDKGLKGGIHFVRLGENLDDFEELIYGECDRYLEIVRDVGNPYDCEFTRSNFEVKHNEAELELNEDEMEK